MASFCDSSQAQNNQYQYADPLGPSGAGGTGAPALRSNIFNYLSTSIPQANRSAQNYAGALTSAAASPVWGTAQENASKNAAGDYLAGSPQLDRATAANMAAAGAAAANENARIRSGYAKNGMTFSTGNQQAEQANTAAANATASNQNAQTYLQNYLSERANQNNAGSQMAQAQGTPLNYLAAVPGAYTSGTTGAAGLLTQLSGGGQNLQVGSNGVYTPSTGSSILNGIGGL